MGPKDGTPLPNEKRAKWMPRVFCQGFGGQLVMALNGLVFATIELRI